MEADEVSTPFTYDLCTNHIVNPNSFVCNEWTSVVALSAPVTPPFIYNNQCGSVVLTSYIPVLTLGFSVQLVLTFIAPVILFLGGKWLRLRDVSHGILWPEYWLNSDTSDIALQKEMKLNKNHSVLLNTANTMCFSILHSLSVMLTFGLTSPFLAVAIACTVASKMSLLVLLIGRFTSVLRRGDSKGVHFALASLANLSFPLTDVLRRSFWLLMWTSSLFFCFICWDIAGDSVGWLDSIWIPIVTLCYPVCLTVVAMCVKRTRLQEAACHGADSGGGGGNDDCDSGKYSSNDEVVENGDQHDEQGVSESSKGVELAAPRESLNRPSADVTTNPIHLS